MLALFALAGCTSSNITEPKRSGIEQLLLSTAVDEALAEVELPDVQGEDVFIDTAYFESYDHPYVLGAIRALLNQNGARLKTKREDATLIVEPRSGALGTDSATSLLGIPEVPLLVPTTGGGATTPEISLYASHTFDTVSKLALLAYRPDGENVFDTGPLVGKSHFHKYTILLLLDLNFTNIPEREDY